MRKCSAVNTQGEMSPSTMASESKLEASEREMVSESGSLLRDKVGIRVAVTG